MDASPCQTRKATDRRFPEQNSAAGGGAGQVDGTTKTTNLSYLTMDKT
jgi:hypothetical protein